MKIVLRFASLIFLLSSCSPVFHVASPKNNELISEKNELAFNSQVHIGIETSGLATGGTYGISKRETVSAKFNFISAYNQNNYVGELNYGRFLKLGKYGVVDCSAGYGFQFSNVNQPIYQEGTDYILANNYNSGIHYLNFQNNIGFKSDYFDIGFGHKGVAGFSQAYGNPSVLYQGSFEAYSDYDYYGNYDFYDLRYGYENQFIFTYEGGIFTRIGYKYGFVHSHLYMGGIWGNHEGFIRPIIDFSFGATIRFNTIRTNKALNQQKSPG